METGIIFLVGVVAIVGASIWLSLKDKVYISSDTHVNLRGRDKPILLDPRFGASIVLSRQDLGKGRFQLRLNTGKELYPKIKIKNYDHFQIEAVDIGQVMCDSESPVFQVVGGERVDKLKQLTRENMRLKEKLTDLDQHYQQDLDKDKERIDSVAKKDNLAKPYFQGQK